MGVRAVEFYLAGILVPLTSADYEAYATTFATTGTLFPRLAFGTTLSKTGDAANNSWSSNDAYTTATDQRLMCVCNTDIEFDEIHVVNYHRAGEVTSVGVKDAKVYTATIPLTSGDTVYGGNLGDLTKIYDGVILEHPPTDEESVQVLGLSISASPLSFSGLGFTTIPTLTCEARWGLFFMPPAFTEAFALSVSLWDSKAWADLLRAQGRVRAFYLCRITGAENGLPDLTFPISSFQSRRRSGAPSYLQVVAPGTGYLEEIAMRDKGDIVLTTAYDAGGGVFSQEETARVGLDQIDSYQGGRNQSITLSGLRTVVNASYKPVTLDDVVLSSFVSGKHRLRIGAINPYVNPGDTVVFEGTTFTVGTITTTVRASTGGRVSVSMEIGEKADG